MTDDQCGWCHMVKRDKKSSPKDPWLIDGARISVPFTSWCQMVSDGDCSNSLCSLVFTLITELSCFFSSLYKIPKICFVLAFVLTLVTGVSWFFVSCLYVILQHHSFCVFLFALVTGVSWFFANCLNVILQIRFGCILIGYRGITILCELPINESSISLYVLFCIHIG